MKIEPIRRSHRPTRKRSQLSERRLARLVGGRVQPASGALPVASLKGDVSTKDVLYEDKVTSRHSFGVSTKLLHKIQKQAREAGKRFGVLHVQFDNEQDEFFVVPAKMYSAVFCGSLTS